MHIGSLPQVSNQATWTLRIEVFDDEDNSRIDVTALVEDMVLTVRDVDSQSEVLTGSLSGGELAVLDLGVVRLSIDAGRMRSLRASKTYEVGVLTTMKANGAIDQTILGTLPVLDGL